MFWWGVAQRVVATNLLGSMFGSRAAMRVMQAQPRPGGKIFLVDGQVHRPPVYRNNIMSYHYNTTSVYLSATQVAQCASHACACARMLLKAVAVDTYIACRLENADLPGCAACHRSLGGGGGQGSSGSATPHNAAYGATKAALVQLKVSRAPCHSRLHRWT